MISQVDTKTKRTYKPKEITLEYRYIEPKTPQEKVEQQKILDDIFDVIFEETIEHLKDKKSKLCYNPDMAITITQISPDRWREYRDLRLESLRDFQIAFDSSLDEEEALTNEEWQEKFNDPNSFKIFAEDNGVLVAKMEVEWDSRRILRHIGELFGVYIKPTYQHQGIGMMLWNEVEKVSKTKGLEKFWLDVISTNSPAIHLYEKMGFKTLCVREKAAKVDGKYYDKLLMERFI